MVALSVRTANYLNAYGRDLSGGTDIGKSHPTHSAPRKQCKPTEK
jgi:hypothetical protein